MPEIGYQVEDLLSWGAMSADTTEANPALRWPQLLDVYGQMRLDAQVKSTLLAVALPVRRANWALDATGCRREVVEVVSQDLDLPIRGEAPVPSANRRRGRFSWQEHLRLAQLEDVFGHSVFEQVGDIEDGLWRLKKLAWRPHRTISNWKVAKDGGLVHIEQYGGKEPIPVEHLVVYVRDREGGNWVGNSLLRAGYKNWLLKDRMMRAQALTVERNGLGIPVYTGAPLPEGVEMSAAEVEAWHAAQRDEGLKLAKGLRAGENAGVSIPAGAKLELMGVSGKLPDTDGPIRYHDEQIARAVLAHFLNLGTETGSWALGSTFADFFASSLQASALHLADVTQQHVIDDMVDLNWGESEPAPRLVFDEIGASSPATAEAIKSLVDAGVIRPDRSLEEYLRQRYKLPVKDAPAAGGAPTAYDNARALAEQLPELVAALEKHYRPKEGE